MSETFAQVVALVADEKVLVSAHGYDELAADDIFVDELFDGVSAGMVIEDYPDYHKGPSVLVLQADRSARPVHWFGAFPKVQHFQRSS